MITGTSQTNNAPILKAAFWVPGRSIEGRIVRHVTTQYGPLMEIKLLKPISARKPGQKELTVFDSAMLGNQAGLRIAADNAGIAWPWPIGVSVKVTSTGVQKTGKGNDMILFSVDFDLPGEAAPETVGDAYEDWSV